MSACLLQPPLVAPIENLSIANADFTEFADHTDDQGGAFRGFED